MSDAEASHHHHKETEPPDTPVTHPARRRPSRLRSRAWRIAAGYAAIATLWIYFSDQALELLIPDPVALMHWSVYKGTAFVGLTALLLWLTMLRAFGAIDTGFIRLNDQKRTIERFNRLYAALSEINQAIVWSSTREELLAKACQALCEHGRFRMAWVGFPNATRTVLTPIASYDDDQDYLNKLIELEGDIQGPLPSARAFNEDRPHVRSHIADELANEPWPRQLCGRGSCAAFPIHEKDEVCGVLSVYADEPGFFEDREIALLVEVARDVSFALDKFLHEEERRQIEARAKTEQMFSEAMLDSMPGIVYFYNEEGRFLRWNRNFETVSGYSGEEIAAMHPLQFFSQPDHGMLTARITQVFDEGESFVEALFQSKGGGTAPYYFTGKRVMFDGMRCLVGVGVNIAQRKFAEQALRELNETLEQKIEERTAQLQDAVVRAEAADRLKSAFLATMSHELRTPLNSIIGFTSIVLQGLPGPLNAEQSTQLGMVRNSAHHLLALINDVLDLSKIEAGQLKVRNSPIELPTSIHNVTDSIRPLAERKGLALIVDPLPAIGCMTGDVRRVEQILLNLLSNAVKFTDRGHVRLTVKLVDDFRRSPAAPPAKAVQMSVADTGIGIRAEELRYLFQPFRQIDNGLARQHEGTGLGLAICRRLANLMGGEVSACSEWAIGSTFTITLPLQPSVQA